MLNKRGEGTVYFGVKPNGELIGQKDANDSTARDISRKIAEGIRPQIIPNISMEYYGDKKVIKVTVKGNKIPYSAFGLFYMRSFDEDRQISPELLGEIMNSRGENDYIIEEAINKKDLSFKMLKNLFIINGFSINEDKFIENNHLKTFDGRYNYMAELLADENDVSIKVVTFQGKNKSVVLKRTDYGYKCLLVAINQVIEYMESINETKVKIGGFQRKEEKYFNIEVFKEAWVNACAHTRWIEKIPPAVYIFEDRIEIISNGGLPKNLNKEDFFQGVSKPMNKELLNIMAKLDIIDQTGHGVPLIVEKYGKKAFYISDNTIIVTIPINKELLEKGENVSKYELNNTEEKIIKEIIEDGSITLKELANKLEIGNKNIEKNVSKLKKDGYIKRIGSNKKGYWKVIR